MISPQEAIVPVTHDELCTRPLAFNCDCSLIDAVRQDEREKIAQSIHGFADVFGSISTPMLRVVAEMAKEGRRKY